MANWNKANPNRVMTNAEIAEYNCSILRPILDDTQYKNYQNWQTGYPNNLEIQITQIRLSRYNFSIVVVFLCAVVRFNYSNFYKNR